MSNLDPSGTLLNSADDVLLLHEVPTASGHKIAVATLNNEKTLNSLSLAMIDILQPQLARWEADEQVVALWLQGAGERALAAGGDIQALYHAIVNNHSGKPFDSYAEDFFEREYRLDYALHQSSLPIIGWGQGVVMGGGLGLFTAADIRIASEKSRVAMPEVTIGLFPDAGGTWMLRNLPDHLALWIGLSGSHLNAGDCCWLGLANHYTEAANKQAIWQSLLAAPWQGAETADREVATQAVATHCVAAPESPLSSQDEVLKAKLPSVTLTPTEAAQAMQELASTEALAKGVAAFEAGCPTTVGIVLRQLQKAADMDMAQCFRMELTIGTHCARNTDFMEGVRALLIDKDNAPQWKYATIQELPQGWVDSHFEPPWPAHPMADL